MAIVATVITINACNDDSVPPVDINPVEIMPSVATGTLLTRSGEALATLNPDATLVLGYNGAKADYKYSSESAKWAPVNVSEAFYWDKIAPGADNYYTFSAMAPLDYSSGGFVANHGTNANYLAADILGGTYVATARNEKLNIELGHKLAQMVVNVTTAEADMDLRTATLTIKGLKPTYDATGAATGAAADITPYIYSRVAAKAEFMNVVPVQSVALGGLQLSLSVEVAGTVQAYNWTSKAAIDFEAGKSTTFNISLAKSAVGVVDVKVTDWVPVTPVSGALSVVVGGTAATVDGVAPAFTEFQLWKNTYAHMAITYFKDGDGWKLGPNYTPFMIENTLPTDWFYARHEPATGDAVTGVKDIQITDGTKMQGGSLALLFKHTKAKLTINIAKDDTYPDPLPTPTLKFLNFPTGSTGTSHSFIMDPYTIGANDPIATIELETNSVKMTYTVTHTSTLVLQEGKHTTLNVTILPTEVKIGVVKVVDWTTETVASSAAVQVSDASVSGLPSVAGVLKLEYGTSSILYDWDGTDLSLQSGSTPLLWESITGTGPYVFGLTFTPSAAGTPAKDILTDQVSVTNKGGVPQFNLAHVNARVVVNLIKGGSYTNLEWAAIGDATDGSNVSLTTVTFAGICTPAYVVNYDFSNGVSGIFAPKATLGTDDKLTVVIPVTTGADATSGNTLVVPLADRLSKLAAGTQYTLNVTVDKTAVSVGKIEIADWNEVDRTGDFTYD